MKEIEIEFKKSKKGESYSVSMNLGHVTYLYCDKSKERCKEIYNMLDCVRLGIEHNFDLVPRKKEKIKIDLSDIR